MTVIFFIAEAFDVNRKRREGSHVTQLQTDKRTHTVPHTRTPTPRLGRRDERMEQPEGGDKNTQRRGVAAASRCPASRDSPALLRGRIKFYLISATNKLVVRTVLRALEMALEHLSTLDRVRSILHIPRMVRDPYYWILRGAVALT